MEITVKYGLPFITLKIRFRDKERVHHNILIDTGSVGLFKMSW